MNSNLYLLGLLALIGSTFSSEELFTSKEKIALKKFAPLVNDITTHDYQKIDSYLIRWLRAKNLNVDDAVVMFTEAQKWRKENKIDEISKEDFPEFSRLNYTSIGRDYKGRICKKNIYNRNVITAEAGNFDIRKIVIQGKVKRFQRFSIKNIEEAISLSFQPSVNLTTKDTRMISIVDLNGFSLRKLACIACIPIQIEALQTLDRYYPGHAVVDIFINAPRIALPIVETMTNFASEERRKSIKIFGTDRTEWSTFLLKIIPANQLLYQFGGTKSVGKLMNKETI